MYKTNSPKDEKDEKIIEYLNHLANEVLSARHIMFQQYPFPQHSYQQTELTLYVGHKEFYTIMSIDRGDSTAPVRTMEGNFIWFGCPIIRVINESYFNIAPQYTQWKI